MIVACWSGPRNISTALMRSWSSRKDTFVTDEPFYAYYLKETRINHPMYEKIINSYFSDYDEIVNHLISKVPNQKKIWYQKHMAHHLIDLSKIDFLDSSGLGALVQVSKEFKNLKLSFSVVGNSRVAQTIKLVRLGDFLNLKSTLDEALIYLKN